MFGSKIRGCLARRLEDVWLEDYMMVGLEDYMMVVLEDYMMVGLEDYMMVVQKNIGGEALIEKSRGTYEQPLLFTLYPIHCKK